MYYTDTQAGFELRSTPTVLLSDRLVELLTLHKINRKPAGIEYSYSIVLRCQAKAFTAGTFA